MKKVILVMGCWIALLVGLWGNGIAGDFKLPDTGIERCYNANNAGITCPQPGQSFYGQDAQYEGPQPAYRANGDGTTTDLNTGLMWQRSDNGEYYTWDEAVSYCSRIGLAGYYDWRLPNISELISIVAFDRNFPAVNPGYFPSQKHFYWSSSPCAGNSGNAWYVYINLGTARNAPKSLNTLFYARCVRTGP